MANANGPEGQHDDPDPARQAGGQGARHFVNHIEFFLSLSEVRFDLATLGNSGRVWRFVTTPHHLQSLHGDMSQALASYEQRFGALSSARGRGDG